MEETPTLESTPEPTPAPPVPGSRRAAQTALAPALALLEDVSRSLTESSERAANMRSRLATALHELRAASEDA